MKTDKSILRSVYIDMLANVDINVNWLTNVRDLLFRLGLGYFWYCQNVDNVNEFISLVKFRLNDSFVQEMSSYFENSPKCSLYRYLPDTHCLQYYLRKSIPDHFIFSIAKLDYQHTIYSLKKADILRYQEKEEFVISVTLILKTSIILF